MSIKSKSEGTSRQAEEQHLRETLAVIYENREKYAREVKAMRESIDDMQAHFHDDNPELINELENTYTMYDFLSRTLMRNERALKKPYFGRIDYRDEALGTWETFYIGRGGISKDVIHPIVIDWRAPVANAYYENGLGPCSYLSPAGKPVKIDLKLKRTYEIEDGKLQNVFDTEVVANDDLLTKYLSKNKQAVLGEIVATIQKEQNEIIRKTPYHNCIVQGVAGSGKTTVAMHRISYILYNYEDRFRPEDFYIVGSNRILLNYITGVLPDLDVYGVRQMTMEQLFVRLLYEDWDEKKYRIKSTEDAGGASLKGTLSWFRELEAFCNRLEQDTIYREDIYLNSRQFVEGIEDGRTGVFDRTGGRADPGDLVLLMEGGAVERYLKENPSVSIQSKIRMLNERLQGKIKDEFLGKGVKYTEAERKAILKFYRGRYGGTSWKKPIFAMYEDYLLEQLAKGHAVEIPDKAFDVYDLAALAYLYKRVKETEVISEAHHIVIDEAQDFGMMAYSVLNVCIKDCTYTIMGDVSQNIHFGTGLNDWEELKELYLTNSRASFNILKKSYRNTVEISDFATRILHHGRFAVYPVEPIIRHGSTPRLLPVKTKTELFEKAAAQCRTWQQEGLGTIAVICRSQQEAREAVRELGQRIQVMESSLEQAVFGNGVLVLPVEYTKGLEFDAVLILDPTRKDYPTDDGHAKLLYVAATRALHELCIMYTGDLTGLIADPVPEGNVKVIAEPVPEGNVKGSADSAPKGNGKAVMNPGPGKNMRNSMVSRPKPQNGRPEQRPGGERQRRCPGSERPEQRPGGKRPESSPGGLPERPLTGKTSGRQDAMPAIPFGSLPATELLRPLGHSKTDQRVRWVSREPDGMYLHSSYGVLRLCPVDSKIIRVTFARGGRLLEFTHPKISASKPYREWMYRENNKLLEMTTDDLFLQAAKETGAVSFGTRDKRLLLAERSREGRLLETTAQGQKRFRQYLDWPKGEKLYALGAGTRAELSLQGTARYISHCGGVGKLPLIVSEKGYGLLIASDGPVFCCDIPSYGAHFCGEDSEFLDYYFMLGKDPTELFDAYNAVCKK